MSGGKILIMCATHKVMKGDSVPSCSCSAKNAAATS
jgi:hypothetical protein